MDISPAGLDFIKGYERLALTRYIDQGGFPTIGWGHKLRGGENYQTIDAATADQLLANDVSDAVSAVNRLVKVPLTQAMFDALVSYAFNWGASNFAASSTLRYLNSGDYSRAAKRIEEWPITTNGQKSNGLIRRRGDESAMFLSQGLPDGSSFRRPVPTAQPQRTPAKK